LALGRRGGVRDPCRAAAHDALHRAGATADRSPARRDADPRDYLTDIAFFRGRAEGALSSFVNRTDRNSRRPLRRKRSDPVPATSALFETALARHQAGDIVTAEQLYRAV